MVRDERRKVEELFKQDPEVRILIATDAAGEGINLQRAHLMINYDLPWNPNRLEQRFGRIHRIGQTEVCHLWNLVSAQTREGMVFQRLFQKLEEERGALGGKVFDILGKVTFDNKPLRELLIEAVRYGNDPAVRARLQQVVDNSLDQQKLRELLDERALTDDTMDVQKVLPSGKRWSGWRHTSCSPTLSRHSFWKPSALWVARYALARPDATRSPLCPRRCAAGICRSALGSQCCNDTNGYALKKSAAMCRA